MKQMDEISLSNADRMAIKDAVKIIKERLGAVAIVLYGSKARGDAHKDSDIDLLIVVPQSVSWRERKAIVGKLFEIGMQHDCMISILIVTELEWKGGLFTSFPIYDEIVRDGVLAA